MLVKSLPQAHRPLRLPQEGRQQGMGAQRVRMPWDLPRHLCVLREVGSRLLAKVRTQSTSC